MDIYKLLEDLGCSQPTIRMIEYKNNGVTKFLGSNGTTVVRKTSSGPEVTER